MGTAALTHYQTGSDLARCGKHLAPNRLTTTKSKVTCRTCRGVRGTTQTVNQSKAQKHARLNPSYGDDNFPGAGKLRCRNCNQPYNIHPLAVPCPFGPDR